MTAPLAAQLRAQALAHIRAAGDLRQQRRAAIAMYVTMDRMWQRIIGEIEQEMIDEQLAAADANEACRTAKGV